MGEHNEKIDPDILRGREDILRARRAAAGRQSGDENPAQSSGKSHAASDSDKAPLRNTPQSTEHIMAEPSPMMKAVVDANKQKRTEQKASDVPVFDVAQKILVRQRQAAAAKRTAPTKARTAEPAEPVHFQTRIDRIEHNRPGYNRIVAEIVARDIDGLCRG
jgi:hypothetical protein